MMKIQPQDHHALERGIALPPTLADGIFAVYFYPIKSLKWIFENHYEQLKCVTYVLAHL